MKRLSSLSIAALAAIALSAGAPFVQAMAHFAPGGRRRPDERRKTSPKVQADHEALARAEEKRERRAAKRRA